MTTPGLTMINQHKLAMIEMLAPGGHETPAEGMCMLEAVAYVTGEPFDDMPASVCQIISGFGRWLNDEITDDLMRTRYLLPLVPLLVGTRVDLMSALTNADAVRARDVLQRRTDLSRPMIRSLPSQEGLAEMGAAVLRSMCAVTLETVAS